MNSLLRLLYFFVFVIILSIPTARADFKCEFGNKQTPMTLQGTKDSVSFRVDSPKPFSAEVFVLEGPLRIVMDFAGLDLKSYKSPPIPRNQILKSVRIAISPRKARIVLDLKLDEIPEYSTSQEGNTFTFSAGLKPEILSLSPPETPTATVIPDMITFPTVAASPTVTPSATVPVAEEAEEIKEPETTPTEAAPSPTQKPEGATPSSISADIRALKSIDFQPAPEPILRLSLTKESSFRLSKEKESYLLTVPDCGVMGEHLLLPGYPPEGFPGINVVKGATEKNDLLLWLYVARTARLSAYRNGTEIWVKVIENK